MSENKGFYGSLFDLSFTEFITTRIVKFLYVIAIIISALIAIAFIGIGFSRGSAVGVIALLLSPIIFTFYLLMARVWLELVIVIFRIAENTGRMADKA